MTVSPVYPRPTSFSQNNLARGCLRQWYYKYLLKLEVLSDMSYANGGTCVHTAIENFYKGLENSKLKEQFEKDWLRFKLNESVIKDKKDSYWLMVLTAIEKNISLTSTEYKIWFDDVVGYLDGISTENLEIHDWKSSTPSAENEEEYKMQLKFYAYLYQRKFDVMPKKCVCHYLKSKKEIIIQPTGKDINEACDWHYKSRILIETAITNNKFPKCTDEGRQCNHFCAYKEMCNSNTEGKLSLILRTVGNHIHIIGPVTPLLHKGIDKKFSYTLKDAKFIEKRLKEKYPDRHIHYDGVVHFYSLYKQTLPIGFMKELVITLQHYAEHKKLELDLKFEDTRKQYEKVLPMPEKFVNGKTLRDYQIVAVDKYLKEKIAMLELATGSGKTEVAIELIRRLGCKTLFLVDKIELLRQTKKRIEDSLGIEVGEIGGGEEVIYPITVATIQTIIKNINKYKEYLNSVMFCIYDECHHISSKSYQKVSNYLINTQYRLGASGTAFRDDGNDMAINSICGYKCHSLNAKSLITDGWLVPPTIKFINVYMSDADIQEKENKSKVGTINETDKYSKFYYEFVANNSVRNWHIKKLVDENKGKKILILTKLVDHGKFLADLVNGVHLYGETNKEKRKELMEIFKNNDINNVMVSTISIFSEGIDNPQLDIIINASANKGDVKSIQVLGRVLRKSEGKVNCYYYDFNDVSNRFFKSASRKRIQVFYREGYEVEVI